MQDFLNKLKGGDGAISAMLWVALGAVILIVVIVLAMWLIRAIRPTFNMSGGGGRGGRPQRLAVTDFHNLDREGRKLVIVRRDNTEHLLLIGGPNDVLVESNIQRNDRPVRGRGEGGETMFPSDSPQAATDTQRPQVAQPPVMAPVAPAAPMARPSAPPAPRPMPAPAPIAAPVAPSPPPVPPASPALPSPAAGRLDDEFERALAAMQDIRPGTLAGSTLPPPVAPQRPAPSLVMPPPASAPQRPTPAAPPPPLPPQPVATPAPAAFVAPPGSTMPPPGVAAQPAQPRTEPMSEMARRLNEVLQKPLATPARPIPAPPAPAPQRPLPQSSAPVTPTPQAAASGALSMEPGAKPAEQIEKEMDLLEEEMARLLGRPGTPGKP